jgi:hypothetical protein
MLMIEIDGEIDTRDKLGKIADPAARKFRRNAEQHKPVLQSHTRASRQFTTRAL